MQLVIPGTSYQKRLQMPHFAERGQMRSGDGRSCEAKPRDIRDLHRVAAFTDILDYIALVQGQCRYARIVVRRQIVDGLHERLDQFVQGFMD